MNQPLARPGRLPAFPTSLFLHDQQGVFCLACRMETGSTAQIVADALTAFREDVEVPPNTTLRGGNHLDSYAAPPPFDPRMDTPTDDYLEEHAFHALPFLDAHSWRHYLPALIAYSLQPNRSRRSMVTEGLLLSLRPPDREPPRLATLSSAQRLAVERFLTHLAFGEVTRERDLVLQVLQEWWPEPGPLGGS
jgi:hypothetical protein